MGTYVETYMDLAKFEQAEDEAVEAMVNLMAEYFGSDSLGPESWRMLSDVFQLVGDLALRVSVSGPMDPTKAEAEVAKL